MSETAVVFPPGHFIAEEIEARGWSQVDLAAILGKHVQGINLVIQNKRGISPEMALMLSAAFGTSPRLWMELDSVYRLSQVPVRDEDVTVIARRATLFSLAPVRAMIARNWLNATDDIDDLEGQIMRFYEVDSIEALGQKLGILEAAAKSSESGE